MVNPMSDTAYGDFVTMGLMDAATHEALGIDWAVNGGYTAAEVTADLAEFGLNYTHSGLINNVEGTLGAASGLDTVANNAGAGSTWFGYWSAFLNPELNGHVGSDMNGDYGLQATWIITFQQ